MQITNAILSTETYLEHLLDFKLLRLLDYTVSICFWTLCICANPITVQAKDNVAAAQIGKNASTVQISEINGRAALLVNGMSFTVNGAGMGFRDENGIQALASAGGTAFRTWGTDRLKAQLDSALKHGLMVLVGLDVGTQLQGFDYTDENAVSLQNERLLAEVRRYKEHPSVLGWILGNEPNLMVDEQGQVVMANENVYSAIGKLASDINIIDPHHPTTVTFAFTSTLAEDIEMALAAAPALKFISIQAYGAVSAIPKLVNELKLPVPFMITEYGPLGHWEMPFTRWGREIEESSGQKAKGMRERMHGSVINDPTGRLLGSFAFLWGHKQERTPTWYGLFLKSGERTSSVDELTHAWTGNWPANRAPSAWSITLQDQTAGQSITVNAGQELVASAHINDPENDPLTVRWELLEEVDIRSHGGHFERTPASVTIEGLAVLQKKEEFSASFVAPSSPGEYRLFAYAFDGSGGAATANVPFLVID